MIYKLNWFLTLGRGCRIWRCSRGGALLWRRGVRCRSWGWGWGGRRWRRSSPPPGKACASCSGRPGCKNTKKFKKSVLLCNGRTDNKWEVSGKFLGAKSMYSPHPVNEFSTHFLSHCFSIPIPQRVNVLTMTLHISLSKHVGCGN